MAPALVSSRAHCETALPLQLPPFNISPKALRSGVHRTKPELKLPLLGFLIDRPLRAALVILLLFVLVVVSAVSWAILNPDTQLHRDVHSFAPAEEWSEPKSARRNRRSSESKPSLWEDGTVGERANTLSSFGADDSASILTGGTERFVELMDGLVNVHSAGSSKGTESQERAWVDVVEESGGVSGGGAIVEGLKKGALDPPEFVGGDPKQGALGLTRPGSRKGIILQNRTTPMMGVRKHTDSARGTWQDGSVFERGAANSSGSIPPDPHPVVAFVIKALMTQLRTEKEPTLESALETGHGSGMPEVDLGGRNTSKKLENSDEVRRANVGLESLGDTEKINSSLGVQVGNNPELVVDDGSHEEPTKTPGLDKPVKLRTGSPLESLKRSMSERRPNLIPNPNFWATAYHGAGTGKDCDLGDGEWVEDAELEPLETAHCRYTQAEQCEWRLDSKPNFQSYRWLPYECDLPFFDPELFLAQWRDKTILVVGDSLGRNFFEALLCQLSSVGPLVAQGEESDRGLGERETGDQKVVEGEASERGLSNRGATELFWSERFNVTVGRVTSEFLVMRDTNAEELERFGQKAGKDRFLLSLDRLDPAWEALLPRTDLLILNSGHWWVSKSKRKAYLLGGELQEGLDSSEAYKMAMRHVRAAVEGSEFKGVAIFRTFSDAHYHKGDWDTPGANCKSRRPEETIKLSSKLLRFLSVQEEIFGGSSFRLMEVTRLSEYRHDGHIGPRDDLRGKWDCTHWCAGGVPNTWLDVMQAMLVA